MRLFWTPKTYLHRVPSLSMYGLLQAILKWHFKTCLLLYAIYNDHFRSSRLRDYRFMELIVSSYINGSQATLLFRFLFASHFLSLSSAVVTTLLPGVSLFLLSLAVSVSTLIIQATRKLSSLNYTLLFFHGTGDGIQGTLPLSQNPSPFGFETGSH